MDDLAIRDMTGSQSVDRATKLLSLVGRQADGMTLSAVVEKSGLNKPTVRRLLLALIRAGLLEQDDRDRRYYIGEEAYVLGTLASGRHGLLRLSTESLHRLAQKTSDSCFLSVRRGASSVCLHREEGSFPIRTHALQAGSVHPLGVGAGSLAMLSALPDEEVSAVLEQNAAVLENQFPMLAPDELRRRVELTRIQGYAVNPGLILANSWGVGVAIRYPDGGVAGAVSIAAIDSRMQEPRQSELAVLLRQEASRIEIKLAEQFRDRRTLHIAAVARPLKRRSPR
ncbi:helix-turn-helix domain-containing protein [Sinorhizobium medicae]|uniref:IclR family transcriptional regulator n=1 Tax=Sinorhizobium medicae TaxID=110321 RepID=UPI000C7E7C65|nr:IclR family transcriptional regulator [Sinorhizobium medicae]MDX0979997.1 helix-turn-helix domain-containing protein [Sinorhizobium medicae]MQV88951.1 helix-turn-helix domain-containing protein [Sinorhizobium medicae]MQV91841.1 helix-turn-helix domain-containing protein [Sinorhizobium medicae]PLT85230.1 transcriptional regulator [Sinorhizobium medicae]RVP52142.1 IclR family transcriptional regulator [Sinorhizobium medicae]